MAFKHAAGHHSVDDLAQHIFELDDALLGLLSFHHRIDFGEEVLEQFERELLHHMDSAECDEQELEHGALVGDGDVDFAGLLDAFFGFLGFDLRVSDQFGVRLRVLDFVYELRRVKNCVGVRVIK